MTPSAGGARPECGIWRNRASSPWGHWEERWSCVTVWKALIRCDLELSSIQMFLFSILLFILVYSRGKSFLRNIQHLWLNAKLFLPWDQ